MSGVIEHGVCEICGKEDILNRRYYRYDIKCECHSPNHFELVRFCRDCNPKEPQETTVTYVSGSSVTTITVETNKLEKL